MKAEEQAIIDGSKRLIERASVALCPPNAPALKDKVKLASGALIEWKGRVFVVTAAHYLEYVAPSAMTVVFASEDSLRAPDVRTVKIIEPRIVRTHPHAPDLKPIGVWPSSKEEDVALLEIDPVSVPAGSWKYDATRYKSAEGLTKDEERLLMFGFPSTATTETLTDSPHPTSGLPQTDITRIGTHNVFYVKALKNHKNIIDFATGKSFNPRISFAVTYDPAAMPERIEPEGLSGCGVWRAGSVVGNGGIVAPSPTLMGIEVAKIEDRKCLKVTKIESVMKLLRKV